MVLLKYGPHVFVIRKDQAIVLVWYKHRTTLSKVWFEYFAELDMIYYNLWVQWWTLGLNYTYQSFIQLSTGVLDNFSWSNMEIRLRYK